MFKLAIDAGHGINTAGKRVDKALDSKQTREWTLNDRVARYIAEAAQRYEDVETLRVDDTTGKKDISLSARCKAANLFDADMYIACHHNAGIKQGTGGGIVAYCYKLNTRDATYRDAIYKACISAGGLKGNRSNPTPEKGYYVLKHTKMPAVLMEYGFMDSKTDAPVILTDGYAKKVAYATMEAIAQVAGLKKRTETEQKKEVYCEVNVRILKNGASGDDVKAMQQLLEANGCKGKMDSQKYGSFGSKTEEALKQYQKKVGLPQTGKCDEETWSKLLGVN